jgi:hypothetical protein
MESDAGDAVVMSCEDLQALFVRTLLRVGGKKKEENVQSRPSVPIFWNRLSVEVDFPI